MSPSGTCDARPGRLCGFFGELGLDAAGTAQMALAADPYVTGAGAARDP
jgi:hypothetical protein